MPERNLTLVVFLSIMTGVTLLNACLRAQLKPVFDETYMVQDLAESARHFHISSAIEYVQQYWINIWYEPPQGLPQRPLHVLYRPLHVLNLIWTILTFRVFNDLPIVLVWLHSSLLGIGAALIYLVGFRLLRDHGIAAGGALLMAFSLPAITGTWSGATGFQGLVVILVCLVLWSYLNFKETRSWRWVIPILLAAVAGPLIKEYISVGLYIIILAELVSARRDWLFLCILVPFVLHSFFPAFFINLVFFRNVVLSSLFYKSAYSHTFSFAQFHFEAIPHFIFTVPPMLSLLGVLGLAIGALEGQGKRSVMRLPAVFFLLIGYAALFVSPRSTLAPLAQGLSLIMLVWISLSIWPENRILAVWTLLSWLPFLIFFGGSEVYFMYAIGPLAMIFLWHIKRLMVWWSSRGPMLPVRYPAALLVLIMLVVFVDQALNPVAAFRMYRDMNRSAETLARRIVEDSGGGAGNVLISAGLVGKDIDYYLASVQRRPLAMAKYTFFGAVTAPEQCTKLEQFAELVEGQRPARRIYLLDVDLYRTFLAEFVEKLDYRIKRIATYSVDVRYPYVDILKYLVPVEYASFPGSPDWWSHFEKGQGLFWRRNYVGYMLYRIE